MLRIRWVLLWVLVPVACAPGYGFVRADEWPVPRGPSREPLPYRYDAKVLTTIPRAFVEDATACVIYAGSTHLLEPDGTVETVVHEITRLNSRKGIDKYGEFRSISFDPTYEKLTLNEARILKANGKVVPVEPKHVQLRDVATDFQVYDQSKQVVISFPNLQVGDAYEVKWTVRGKSKEFDGHFFTRYSFGDDSTPVVLDEFRVRVPKGKTLNHGTINGHVNLVVTDTEGEKLYAWAVRNKMELPKDEDRPSKEELRLQVSVSTFPTWEAVGKWKEKLRKECWECTPEIRKTIDEVTRGLKTPEEKAKALTYWVRRHVRYHSRGPGGAGYTPHMPHQVLSDLYGDCKDQAQLLAVMLREIGLPVWLVTLGTLDDGQVQPEVPSPWGTHAILLTKIDGKDYWIDTTVALAAWDFLPRGDRNRQTYITQDGSLKLMKTPAFTYKDYRIEQTTYVNVQPDGTSKCKREAMYHHSAAWTKRDKWLDVPPGERRRLISAELQDAHAKSKLLSLNIDDKRLLDFDAPARVEVEFEIPKHFTGDPTREASLTDSPVWTWFLGYNLDPERKLAYVLPTPFESVHKYVIRLPLAYRMTGFIEDRDIKSPWGFFTLKYVGVPDDPHRFELHMHMRLEKTRVEPADFAAFLRFQDDVSKAYRVWLNLQPSTNVADWPKLEKLFEKKETADATSLRVLVKGYLGADKTEDARRVLHKAAPWFADDHTIWELRVQASANIEEEEQLYRAMVKQFPDMPTYAVALGAACVRREDHDEARKILTPLTKHSNFRIRGTAHYQLARSEYRQKNADKALIHLSAALIADSSTLATMDALHFKARVHEKLGQYDLAVKTLKDALDAEPTARDALEYLVRLEIQAGERDAALEHLRHYTVAAGKDLSSMVKAADLHLELGRYEEAFDLASKAREVGFQARAQRILGLVHLSKQEYQQAAFHLERCDLDAKALTGLFEAHLRLGDLSAIQRRLDAIKKMESPKKDLLAIEKDVTFLLIRRELMMAQWQPAREQKAAALRAVSRYLCAERGLAEKWPREQLETLVQVDDALPYAPLLALRGWLYMEKGQLRKALADAEQAIKLQPNEPRAHLVRGRVKLEQGKGDEAIEALRQAAKLSNRDDAVILHWLATALFEAGRRKEAVETQRLAVLLRPNDVEMQELLRRIEMPE